MPARLMRERFLNDGKFVFRVGDPPDTVYIVVNELIVLTTTHAAANGTERVAEQGTIFSAAEAMGGPNQPIMAHARG